MRIVLLDTETNGFSTSSGDTAIEVAATLYDCVRAAPMATFATLVYATSNAAEHVNGIHPELLLDGVEAAVAWSRVGELLAAADAVAAHNAPFDRRFTPDEIAALCPWIDTQRDVEWPGVSDGQKLTQIAISLGVPVIAAHRALTDVDLMVRIFQRLTEKGHDVPEMLREALRKKPLLEALVPFERKDEAKAAGFSWEPPPKKRWVKRMSLEAAKKLPFKTKVLEA